MDGLAEWLICSVWVWAVGGEIWGPAASAAAGAGLAHSHMSHGQLWTQAWIKKESKWTKKAT